MRRFAPLFALLASCGSSSNSPPADAGPDVSPFDFAKAPLSCAFACDCTESVSNPYVCPSAGDWKKIPHDSACPSWDGSYPAPQQGKCTASAPSGDAAKYAGADGSSFFLPDGRRITPAGKEWVFGDIKGGLPSSILSLPGSSLVVVVEAGYGPHAVRLVDPAKIDAGVDPTVSIVTFKDPETLDAGIAFVAPDRLFVATADGVVQAIGVDLAKQTLTRDDARSIKLPDSHTSSGAPAKWYVSGVAASPDGTRVVVTGVKEKSLLVFDSKTDSPTYGAQLGGVDLGGNETFGVAFDPHDPSGKYAYVSMWADRKVIEVDLGDAKAPKATRSFATGKDPQGVAFLDARWLAVADDHADTIALVDRVSGSVTEVPANADEKLHGDEPTTLAWDEKNHRLWTTLAGANAIAAWDVDVTASPPRLSPVGMLPTAWWPGGIALQADGSLVVIDLRAHGRGANGTHYGIDDGDVMSGVRGSIQHVPAPTTADLGNGQKIVVSNDDVGSLPGAPAVTCADGADDFPVPSTNGAGPSKLIDHVIYVVRENKAFDGVLGDLPGAEAHADLTFTDATQMDRIWGNFRKLVKTFSTSDNYYISSELSVQGHVWTTTGRSSDYVERTWAMDGDGRDPRHDPAPDANTYEVAKPEEGSMFDWLDVNKVNYGIFGEASSLPRTKPGVPSPIANDYPGGFIQSIDYPDNEKACYLAGRLRVTCDLPSFVYATMPNDHTHGVRNGSASIETMISVNDEATGMLVDAVSHSPFWRSTLIVVLEDDPSQGGDHIDNHRSPIAFVSPWVKRGYVSKTHSDVSSVHKLFSHLLGIPYPSAIVAHAALPLDVFTSTPDYTPFTYAPRPIPPTCTTAATKAEETLTKTWDFERIDEQPGLDAQIARWLRHTQWTTLPPSIAPKEANNEP